MNAIATTEIDYTMYATLWIVAIAFFAAFLLITATVRVAEAKFSGSKIDRNSSTWMNVAFTFGALYLIVFLGTIIIAPSPEGIIEDLGVVSYSENVDLRIPDEGNTFTLYDVTVRDANGAMRDYPNLTITTEGNIVSLLSEN